jgi:hypothetical protein
MSVTAWLVIAVAVGLNFWLDYYHPIGWFLDVIILAVVLVKLYRAENDPVSRKPNVDPSRSMESGTRSKNP